MRELYLKMTDALKIYTKNKANEEELEQKKLEEEKK